MSVQWYCAGTSVRYANKECLCIIWLMQILAGVETKKYEEWDKKHKADI